jgi:hypothetical protein
MIEEVLARISSQNAHMMGDTLLITPPDADGPNGWPQKPFYFLRVEGSWKLDAARTFRVTFQAKRRQPIAGESREQAFAAVIHLISGEFETIAGDIDKGNIPDEAEAQRRVNAAYGDLKSQFSEFGCNTNPR